MEKSKWGLEALLDEFWRPRWGLRESKYGPRGARMRVKSPQSGGQDKGDAEPKEQGPKREGPNQAKIVVITVKLAKVCIS